MKKINYWITSFSKRKLRQLLLPLKLVVVISFLITFNVSAFERNASEINNQKLKVTGTVTDAETNEPLAGVNVVVGGTTLGTITDNEGRYSIDSEGANTVLIFSFVGYFTEKITVNDLSVIDVKLRPDVQSLEEIVVVGYGTQSRQSVTGSVSNLNSKAIANKPVSSIESALQGQVAGISVSGTGAPGQSPSVRIRGIGSISFNSDPLYVIDGVPVGSLNNFDVKDIESVSVLKDASSAAIYGSRAANGVVIITTKKGKRDGKISVNVDYSTGWQQAWKTLDLLNREQYIKFGTDLITNAGNTVPERFGHMNDPIYAGANQTYAQTETDWQKEVFRTAPMSQLNVDLSGGNEKFRIYTSFGRFAQDGIMIGTGYERYSFRTNTELNLNKYISLGENMKVSYSERENERTSGGRTMVKHMLNMPPYIPVYDPTLLGGYRSPNGADGTDAENPVKVALLGMNKTFTTNFVGNAYIDIKPINWLTYRASIGMEYTPLRTRILNPKYNDSRNENPKNTINDNRDTYFSPIVTNQLTFDKIFGKHAVNAVLIAEQQITKRSILNTSGTFTTNELDQLKGTSDQNISGETKKTVLISYAGRINYAFADKYLLNFSIRKDGSSVFAPGHKWGYFPGASLGWVISKESFMQNLAAISDLKVRASYGTLGFNGVDAYPWQSTFSTDTNYPFNNDPTNPQSLASYFGKLPNRDLEWEITKMTDVGVDMAFLENSITFSAEYFTRKTDNLIVETPLPGSMGYSVDPNANVGSMKNWGYEFTLGYRKMKGDFQYSVTGNISFIKNEVLSLSKGAPYKEMKGQTSDYGDGVFTRTEAGHSIQGFYGFVTDGLFQNNDEVGKSPKQEVSKNADGSINYYKSTAAGDIKFKNLNTDNVINDDDRTWLGSYLPDFTYGLNFSANYKNFDVSLFLQGVYGNEIYNGTKVITQGMKRLFNQEVDVLDAWKTPGQKTDIPRAVDGDPNKNTRTSDRFIEDGSYMRIKNLTVGYTLAKMPSFWGNAISGLRIYVTAQNLLTLTKYTGYDPEVASRDNNTLLDATARNNNTLLNGVDFGQYPQPRTLIIGARLSF
ncbi:MAG TPA: TonB-dependent receptor [Bacteroidales bacterium]|nr:TonB-dependent receptor [Bacteroidales bacterium]